MRFQVGDIVRPHSGSSYSHISFKNEYGDGTIIHIREDDHCALEIRWNKTGCTYGGAWIPRVFKLVRRP